MGKPSRLPTHFTSPDDIKRRLNRSWRRDDRFTIEFKHIRVPFVLDFDQFVAQVAHRFRGLMTYGSDDGRLARGLIRANSDIRVIHLELCASWTLKALAEGVNVGLHARIWRRAATKPEDRWVIRIKFRLVKGNVDPDWKDPETIDVDPEYKIEGRRRFMKAFLPKATRIAKNISGEPGKRLRKLLELATDLDHPGNWDLWYYDPEAVHAYTIIDDTERSNMLKATNGKLPADGIAYGARRWRIYPFRELSKDIDGDHVSEEMIRRKLESIDDSVVRSLNSLRVESGRSHGSAVSSMVKEFIAHVVKLQNSSTHLYSAYTGTKSLSEML